MAISATAHDLLIWRASRGHLCDRTAFLLIWVLIFVCCIAFVLFCNFFAAVSAFALLFCSTVHVAALFLFNYCVIEQMNE